MSCKLGCMGRCALGPGRCPRGEEPHPYIQDVRLRFVELDDGARRLQVYAQGGWRMVPVVTESEATSSG